ncbi:fumarylacetoacetate hydrolase family protein [Amycolatopsis jejuensis]|uniref:fumarylacetoacetate hydrolase family protein n=1 Tax=Amycolatopsis jejuensis TaxID=330084 RepID=UPI000525CE42|nr:fumarylacetoacetate hydrolase family protein [Amycolatopsis jejuensis]
MRFVTYAAEPADATDRVGVLDGDRIHALPPGTTLRGLLGDDGERLHAAGEQALRDPHEVVALAGTRLRAPIPDPPTVRDFMTFEQHVEGAIKLAGPDVGVPERWYAAPAFYFTNPYAVLGPHDDVPVPPGSTLFDLELEVAAVIGLGGRDVSGADAERHIAGYCLLNDWSARDLQFAEMEVRLGPAKGKDTSLTLGPMLVTPDELAPYRSGTAFDLEMTAAINDEVIGTDRWNSMHFSYADMIEYASRGTEIRPGDILGSGTSGGGCLAELWGRKGLDAHPPLRPGDTVTISVEQLGSVTSRIVEYPAR